ncbi:MAG: dihydropteroate synthase, partial [Actinomycetota bacterium]|nr:dihydropteroate synthase [Actinomycetota bacterium]
MSIVHARGALDDDRCLVMGIVNRTPDSFYDGGRMDLGAATAIAEEMVDAGADILDLGGVKAGPGPDVAEREELDRVVPLVEAVAARTDVPISVETARPLVASAALDAGAAIVNDVTGADDDELLEVCARSRAALVLMHHGGQIRGRPRHPRYDDVVVAIKQTWEALAARANAAGVSDEALIVDPGLDFGKTTFHSLEVMRRLDELTALRWPVLVAPSRKDVVG